MVQRKPARKKPKDPVAVPAAGSSPVPGSRGGVTARAPLPSYMRATTCSGARAGAVVDAVARGPAAPQPARAKEVLTPAAAAPRAGVRRATCSSAMKGHGAGAAAHACPYAYCSFKGHAHAPPVPPLGNFVAAQRRLIKTQQSMKLKGASPFRKPDTGAGFFVEIRAGAAAPSDVSCGDLSAEEVDAVVGRMECVLFNRLGCGGDAEDAPEGLGAASVDGSCGSSDVISVGSVELLGTSKHHGRQQKETLVDHEGDDFGACKSDISEELDANKHGGMIPEDSIGDAPKESSVDSISSSLSGISFEDVTSAAACAASSQRNRSSVVRRRRTPEEGAEQMRPFKPKPPNFLPAETDPEAEKVDLRHQVVDDRRTAEEWMVDFALRKAVKKLARAQKRKVEMLVQAFETVLPTVANEKQPEQRDGDKRTFTLTWPSQACN